MKLEKLSQYFFLLVAVIAILDGAFTLQNEMQSVKFIVLILAGLTVGVLRQSKKESFLIAGIGVIVTGLLFTQLLGAYLTIFAGVLQMILNFVIFLSASVLVVGLHYVANILSGEREPEEKIEEREVKQFKKLLPSHAVFEKIWSYVMLIAVALTFIVLLSETFFDIGQFVTIILVVDFAITALFITDLFVLYRHADGFGDFLRRNVFDIIAAIPTVGILRVLKIVRVVRFAKAATRASKLAKVGKMHKTTKFLSEDSYFNKVKAKPKAKKTAKKTTKRKSKK